MKDVSGLRSRFDDTPGSRRESAARRMFGSGLLSSPSGKHTRLIFRKLCPALLAIVVAGALATIPAEAKKKRASKAPPPASAQDQPAPAPEPQPYRTQITRLAEILGALTYLDELCANGQGTDWRVSMTALMDAQARTEFDRELMAGAFNRSYRGYRITYRTCTANARTAVARFLAEGKRIAHEVADRYGSS
jgi:uncharacterized protein (TIGR02301 family)